MEPENFDIVQAYHLVADCVHHTLNGIGPPIWSDIRVVLKLHGLWDPYVQRGLSGLFARIRGIAAREHQEKR